MIAAVKMLILVTIATKTVNNENKGLGDFDND